MVRECVPVAEEGSLVARAASSELSLPIHHQNPALPRPTISLCNLKDLRLFNSSLTWCRTHLVPPENTQVRLEDHPQNSQTIAIRLEPACCLTKCAGLQILHDPRVGVQNFELYLHSREVVGSHWQCNM
eukprot:309250-Amphidinium_carterae.2